MNAVTLFLSSSEQKEGCDEYLGQSDTHLPEHSSSLLYVTSLALGLVSVSIAGGVRVSKNVLGKYKQY